MNRKIYNRKSEEGYILVATLLMMLVLTLIGIAANRNTSIELQIAGNDRVQKETFYEADGVTELAQEVLEQNIACLTFTNGNLSGQAPGGYDFRVDNDNLGFWRNFAPIDPPTDSDRIFYFPDYDLTATAIPPHTNINIGGSTKLTTGAAIQMAAGYEGRGKGIGSGGITLVYDIYANHVGINNSESLIYVEYWHIIGNEGDCYY